MQKSPYKAFLEGFYPFLLISIIVITLVAGLVFAHGSEKVVDGYTFALDISPDEVFVGDVVSFTVHITDEQGIDATGLNVRYDIVRTLIDADEVEPGHYNIEHSFEKFGTFEIRIGFIEGNEEITAAFEAHVEGKEAEFDIPWIAAALIGPLLIWGLYFRSKKGKRKGKKKKKSLTGPIVYSLIYLIIVGLSFSVYSFYASPTTQGCEIRLPDGTVVMHCHPSVHIEVCGDNKKFDWEVGLLSAWHTHKNPPRFHIHPERAFTVEEKVQLMNIRTIFSDIEIEFTETSIQDPETKEIFTDEADACSDGNDNKVNIEINGIQMTYQEAIDRLIEDGDEIRIKYE